MCLHPSLLSDRRRGVAQERDKAIAEEIHKLLEANFNRQVYYSDWLANVMIVKRANDKWRTCVDFTDLNKACPKDSYPFLQIDLLMDAFFGYNQIKLDESNQEKISFATSHGLFWYKVMPFRLKNAGATYQRLVNRMFVQQIGRNVKVYVGDMLVKSKKKGRHLYDLQGTFETLHLNNEVSSLTLTKFRPYCR